MYISESEGANFWLQVLTDLNNRGLQDILINLKGFTEAILSIFPKTQVQKCIVHQIRNSLRYIASKDQKEFMWDLKEVYRASSKEVAEDELLALGEKWGGKYPVVIESWQNNWEEFSQYFQYTPPIRKRSIPPMPWRASTARSARSPRPKGLLQTIWPCSIWSTWPLRTSRRNGPAPPKLEPGGPATLH